MIVDSHITIDFLKKMNEKQAKETTSSFIRLISDVTKKLEKLCEVHKKDYSFSMIFDNNCVFSIDSFITENKVITNISFLNEYGHELTTISVKDALNIIKYSLEIENYVKSNFKLNNYEFEATYTEQPADKIIPIYKEKELGMTNEIFIESVNVKEEYDN